MKALKLSLLVTFLAIFVLGCSINVADTHYEADDVGNGSIWTPEDTTFTMNDWYAIEGTISSASDADYYKALVPANAGWLDFNVYHNDEKLKGILGINLFPFHFASYEADGTVLMTYLLQAAVNSQDLDDGTAYIIFYVLGTTDYASGSYRIEFTAY